MLKYIIAHQTKQEKAYSYIACKLEHIHTLTNLELVSKSVYLYGVSSIGCESHIAPTNFGVLYASLCKPAVHTCFITFVESATNSFILASYMLMQSQLNVTIH